MFIKGSSLWIRPRYAQFITWHYPDRLPVDQGSAAAVAGMPIGTGLPSLTRAQSS